METCSSCREELLPDYDFCHHCGAAVGGPAIAPPVRSKLVEMADDLGQIASRSAALGSSANQVVGDWLGGPTSMQRRIFFALFSGLTLMLAFASVTLKTPFLWLSSWLLLSLSLLPLISYWVTGFVPFSDFSNAALGTVQSLRRRFILAFLLGSPTSILGIFAVLFRSGTGVGEDLLLMVELGGAYIGQLFLMFYLMGHTTMWRSIGNSQGSRFLDRMSRDADRVAKLIRERISEREIPDLQVSEIEMAQLRRFTAGESNARHGRQVILTSGRARVVLFVQDFGDSLLIRWGAYFDASGRRLWVLLGLMLGSFNNLFLRWTGVDYPKVWGDFMSTLKPVSRHQLNLANPEQGGLLTKLFGMVEGISEYGWNEIYALHGAVTETVAAVASTTQASSNREAEIHNEIAHQAKIEAQLPFSTGQGGFGLGRPR